MTPAARLQRLDQALVSRGLFESRAKAQQAIGRGLVQVGGVAALKASQLCSETAEICAERPYPWVSRGGEKLAAALEHFHICAQGLNCLDIGASTGGFTDVLLAHGALHVLAVDVGQAQLHEKLRQDARVTSLESCDIRKLPASAWLLQPMLISCDVSFISLKLVLPKVLATAPKGSTLVALIKPQFEAGRADVVKGIVKQSAVHARVVREIIEFITQAGWRVLGHMPSPIAGSKGNREFLTAAQKP